MPVGYKKDPIGQHKFLRSDSVSGKYMRSLLWVMFDKAKAR